jgi:hypothetical protein
MHADELAFFGFRKIKVGKIFPNCNGRVTNQRLFNLAKPPHELGQESPWQSVC